MKKAINQFIDNLKKNQRYSRLTVSAYQADLLKWQALCIERGIHNWQALSRDDIKSLLVFLRQKNADIKSIRRYLTSLRIFFNYLVANKQLDNNSAIGIRTPRKSTKLLKTLSYDEIEVLIKHIRQNNCPKRDLAIFEMLYGSGLRVSELTHLNISDIDFDSGFIKVLGKGAKERYSPLGDFAAQAVKAYLKTRLDKKDALFLSRLNKRLSVRSVQTMFEQLTLYSPLGVRIHPHMLRHSAATHLLQSSHNIRVTQQYLGHQNIKSTQIYTRLDFIDLAKSYDKTHPLAKKDKN